MQICAKIKLQIFRKGFSYIKKSDYMCTYLWHLLRRETTSSDFFVHPSKMTVGWLSFLIHQNISVLFVCEIHILKCNFPMKPVSVRCSVVGRSVGRSVPFLLFHRFWVFWAYSSCPDALVTFSSTAPAHPGTTRVAVYPALLHAWEVSRSVGL